MTFYDVIVVGAGPAGATAAKFLGEAGLSALLLDKSEFPRDKPCGGGISARVTRRFDYLESALRNIPVKWVSKIYFESPSGISVEYESEGRLYAMLRRRDFDHLLLSLARPRVAFQAPALVRGIRFDEDGATVDAEVAQKRVEYRCRIVLGCDGANSIVARAAGLRRGEVRNEYAIDLMEETPQTELDAADRDTMYIYYRAHSDHGYGYLFPKTNYVNLGVGFKLDHYLAERRGSHYSRHRAFAQELISKRLVTGESNPANFRAFPLPISGPLPRTYGKRVLLSGDAGGFVNAFTGEGIYYAMVSGEHAARAAIRAVRANRFSEEHLRAYQDAWKSEIGGELAKSVAHQRFLLASPGRIDRIVSLAKRSPPFADVLARYATGEMSHRALKSWLLRRALPFYLREKLRAFASK
jgi:geranylgeranyl reductase family protein